MFSTPIVSIDVETSAGGQSIRRFHRRTLYTASSFVAILGVLSVSMNAQALRVEARTSVAESRHFWYEIKADPEDPKNLMICGSKWNALRNAALGFVYASWDGGKSWNVVLEDTKSSWVTEQSCAYGPHHRAYFISEAGKVIDGETQPELGTTRLYVSTDSGRTWMETIETGWADYSTSAVSFASGKLYTFFNANTSDVARKRGASVGLLVFSPDGKHVAGPFLNSEMKDLGYEGIYPSNAITLKSGAVAAIYWGTRLTPTDRVADLGIIRADQAVEPSLMYAAISHTPIGENCLNFGQGSLAYDRERNRLFVVYLDGCKNTRILLASSDDEGRTWAKRAVFVDPENSNRRMTNLSLAVGPDGVLGLLWEGGRASGRWFFSQIRDQNLLEPPTELCYGADAQKVSDDSLWTLIYPANRAKSGNRHPPSGPTIALNIRAELGVSRAIALIATDKVILAVCPLTDGDGMRLDFNVLGPGSSASKDQSSTDGQYDDPDVTQQTVILYGGMQHFDSTTETLKVCLFLRNRGDKPLRVPIRIVVDDITSPLGTISILNSTNGLAGVGAVWDISSSVAGNQIPVNANSNSFCLSFRLKPFPKNILHRQEDNLLFLQMRVWAASKKP